MSHCKDFGVHCEGEGELLEGLSREMTVFDLCFKTMTRAPSVK